MFIRNVPARCFQNVSKYFRYFHESCFLYTGEVNSNKLIIKFEQDKLIEYVANDFTCVQKFAEHAYQQQRLEKHDLDVIAANKDYRIVSKKVERAKGFRLS